MQSNEARSLRERVALVVARNTRKARGVDILAIADELIAAFDIRAHGAKGGSGSVKAAPLAATVQRIFDLSPQVSKHIVLQNTKDGFRVFVDDIDITYWIAADGLGDIEVGTDGSRRIPVVLTASKLTVQPMVKP